MSVDASVVSPKETQRHEAYVAFIEQARVGWFVLADIFIYVALLVAHGFSASAPLAWTVVAGFPLLALIFLRRDTLKSVLLVERSPYVIRVTAGCAAVATVSLVLALFIAPHAVIVWPVWLVPIIAASSALVFNGWIQTRGDQVFAGAGIIAVALAQERIMPVGRDGNIIAGLLMVAPFAAASWARKVTGSLFSAFLVYFVSGEILWIAARLGSAHA